MNIKKFWYSLPRFITQPRDPFYIGKDEKTKYASSNFSLYLYRIEKHFHLFSKLLQDTNLVNEVQKYKCMYNKACKQHLFSLSKNVFYP